MSDRGTVADASRGLEATQVGHEYMRFRIAPEIFARFPEYCVGVVVATDLENTGGDVNPTLTASIQQTRAAVIDDGGRIETAGIEVWRRAFTGFGIDPEEFPSSIEALIRAAIQGTGPNPINPAVDLANAVSLRYGLPIGAHDLDKLRGDFEVRLARQGEKFACIGQPRTGTGAGGGTGVCRRE